MKTLYLFMLSLITCSTLLAQTVHINELHYDNSNADVGEFIEIFVTNPQPSNLADYTVSLYNGNNGNTYDTETLDNMSQSTSDGTNNFGTGRYYTWYPPAIQNGAPDGMATSGPSGLIEFLSYEGSFTAANGPASGTTSTDIGASESGSVLGTSIQNNGAGVWVSGLNETPLALNVNDLLPVELTKFTATKNNQNVTLEWQTASEINNDRFEILRSSDTGRFESIGKVDGQGNSLKLIDYAYRDEAPMPGINYYRLKQVDIDGTSAYSDIVYVMIDRKNIKVSPTSTFDYVTVSTESSSSIMLRSITGQVMDRQSDTEGNFVVDMSNYPKGIYYLSVEMNGTITTKKVIRL